MAVGDEARSALPSGSRACGALPIASRSKGRIGADDVAVVTEAMLSGRGGIVGGVSAVL